MVGAALAIALETGFFAGVFLAAALAFVVAVVPVTAWIERHAAPTFNERKDVEWGKQTFFAGARLEAVVVFFAGTAFDFPAEVFLAGTFLPLTLAAGGLAEVVLATVDFLAEAVVLEVLVDLAAAVARGLGAVFLVVVALVVLVVLGLEVLLGFAAGLFCRI